MTWYLSKKKNGNGCQNWPCYRPSITSKFNFVAKNHLDGELPTLLLKCHTIVSFLFVPARFSLLLIPGIHFLVVTSSNNLLSSSDNLLNDMNCNIFDWKWSPLFGDEVRVLDIGLVALCLYLTKVTNWWSRTNSSRMWKSIFCFSA